ncbi:MAG TPA: UvrD-helicase domain-containing protein, partial [Thermoanaerobaculia bacterium]|nr:UvrD-helicase domain-containing protein [Thermoanaerobaculia bacterium]
MTPPLQQAFEFERRVAQPPARRNLILDAGAGTGKTTALVGEVLRVLLENENLAPERIVLVTFTEKAANEIADRIHHALAELQTRLDEGSTGWPFGSQTPVFLVAAHDRARVRAACERQLARIDRLKSQTIHSFCQSILRQFPVEAGLDPQFTIVEGFERSLLHDQIYDRWIDQETRLSPEPGALAEWDILFAHAGYFFLIREMILGLLERRDLLQEAREELFGDASSYLQLAAGHVETLRRAVDHRGVERICNYFQSVEPPPDRDIDAWIAYFRPVAQEIRDAKLPSIRERNKEAIQALRGKPGDSIYDTLVSHRAAMALLRVSRRFVAFLDAEKRRLGVVDFDDLLLRTLQILGDARVLRSVRSQFDYIFVDEFQDTDRTQARILDRLSRDASGNYIPGRTVVVGDPKQSIYAFRRADPETYARTTTELLEGGADRRELIEQHRSDPPLLHAINAMFSGVFAPPPHDPNVFRPAYTPLHAGRALSERTLDARVTLLYSTHDDRRDQFLAEAESIVEWIDAHRTGEEGDLRRFAILFRRLTIADDYLATLDRYGIRYVLPPTRLFLDRRASVDLLAVLRAIGVPFDRGALISAARTPYFGLTDEEIAAGILDGGQAWQSYLRVLESFREAARHRSVAQIVDMVIDRCGIEAVYEAAADGERSKLHLSHLRRIAFDYDQTAAGSVRQFVDEITRRRSEPDEMEPSVIDETENAVRILTIHAAKGLEFDTVIIPDLGFNIPGSGLQIFSTSSPERMVMCGGVESLSAREISAGEELKKIASHRDEAERRRLFYVAVTRARHEVVFACNTANFRRGGFYDLLADSFGIEKDGIETLWSEGRDVREVAVHGVKIPVAFEKLPIRP